ncbi:MAG: cytochrome c biogenesis protein CcsA [Bacteroidaceae bacterium]|nr:cytochrome c biogenesis protein CcsA [Bacteroidaceae bacterium]
MNDNNNNTSYPYPAPFLTRAGMGLLYTLLIVSMGVATIVEKIHGKDYAGEHIYGSWWFITLWGVLAIVSLAFLMRMKIHKKMPVFLLHISFVVMLAGALITHLTSQEGTVHLRMNRDVQTFLDSEQRVQHLPFTMRLEAFDILRYPGTDAVMDYRCEIDVRQETPSTNSGQVLADSQSHQMVVSMNNIGKASGYRFYQSSYDDDGQGTHLLVAHDPYGIAVTYIGYLMLFVSLLWTIFSRHTRIRRLYRMTIRPFMVMAVFCLPFTSALGQTPTPVSSEIAHELGKVVILYNGRLCPVNTAATDFVTKLSGKPSWNGYSADEIFTGWMIFYTEWEQQKIIRIKSAEVQRLLGIEGQWASVRDFYSPEGEYKLRDKVNDSDLPDATRKAIREADEKLQVISMFYGNEMLRMFPLESSKQLNNQPPKQLNDQSPKQLTWHAPGSTELPLGTPEREFQFINHAMDHLVQAILVNDISGAKQMIAKIRLYQQEKVGDALPSKTMIGIEVYYNTLLSARWITFLCLTLSLLLCLFLLSEKGGRAARVIDMLYIISLLTYISALFVMRWLISSHIPMSNGYETMLFMALVTMLITIIMMRRIPILQAFGPVVASFCMLVATLASGSPQITNLMPVLQSPLLSIHVAMVMIAYALLAMITLLAIQGLYLSCKLKSKSRALSQARKSEGNLVRTTALSQLLLYPAIVTLCFGIFVGAIWANVSWGTYWSWDPKETWALITLMIYAIPLHRSLVSWSPARYHLFILLSFLTVLMTYFGVNYFLSGMHSYA